MRVSKEKVEIAMAERNLSQTKLAQNMKIERARLSAIINGKNCRPSTIAKLAIALEIDVKEIILM